MGMIIPVSEQTKQEDRFMFKPERCRDTCHMHALREGLYPLIILPREGKLYNKIYTENETSGSTVANTHQVITHPQI